MFFSSKHRPFKTSPLATLERKRRLKQAAKHSKRRVSHPVSTASSARGRYVHVFLWLVFIAVAAYISLWSPFLEVTDITVQGVNASDAGAIQDFIAQTVLASRAILPDNAWLLVSSARTGQRIEERFPAVQSARVTKYFPHTLRVEVTLREQFLVWCSGGPCFWLDETGRVRDADAPLDSFDVAGQVVRVVDESGTLVERERMVLDPNTVQFALSLQHQLFARLNLATQSGLTTPSRQANELRATTLEGWQVYVATDAPLDATLDALGLFLTKQMTPEVRSQLAYVDLRAPNRVYYALKGETNGMMEEAQVAGEHQENNPPSFKEDTEQKSKKKKK